MRSQIPAYLERSAARFDATFNGLQERLGGKCPLLLFTDRVTGSTIAVERLTELEDALKRSRADFLGAEEED